MPSSSPENPRDMLNVAAGGGASAEPRTPPVVCLGSSPYLSNPQAWCPLASSREPIFNVPGVLVATLGVLLLVHAGRSLLLSPREDMQFLVTFAFIPARY